MFAKLDDPIKFYAFFLTAGVIALIGLQPLSTIIFTYIVAFLAGIWIISFVLVALFLCILGRELLWSSVGLMPSVESVPDGSSTLEVVTLKSQRDRLRHLIYKNEQCVPELAKWVAATLEQTPR